MARRIPGEFVPCDVNLANDPRVMRAGALAELLFRRANEYAKRNDRDGDIESVELGVIAFGIPGNPHKLAAALVGEGLWRETDTGWIIAAFLKWNMSQAEQAQERERKRLGALKTNHKKGQHTPDRHPDCPDCAVAK